MKKDNQTIVNKIQNSFSGGGFMYNLRKYSYDDYSAVEFLNLIESINTNSISNSEKFSYILSIWQIPFLVSCWRLGLPHNISDSMSFNKFFLDLNKLVEVKVNELCEQ